MFMIKNRLHVVAQYLRVKVDPKDDSVEEIIKQIIESLKFSNKSQSYQKGSCWSNVVSSRSRGKTMRSEITDCNYPTFQTHRDNFLIDKRQLQTMREEPRNNRASQEISNQRTLEDNFTSGGR